MLATRAARLPPDDADWGYEPAWGGERTLAAVAGGRVPAARTYPELRELGEALAPVEAVLDGTVVVLDGTRPDPAALARRTRHEPGSAAAKRAAAAHPVQYLIHDLLWLEGTPTVTLGYAQRRELLDGLELSGPLWQTVPWFRGGGEAVLEAARAQGLPGITAKRLDSPYRAGARTRLWLDIAT
jgi:bifunctional non-homologous end joining protein LigD